MKIPTVAVAILLALTSTAMAQDAIVEGPGYELSEGTVLHPSVGAETGAVSNVFREQADAVASPLLRLLADLDIASRPPERLGQAEDASGSTATPPNLEFRAGVRFTYTEYLTGNAAARAQRDLGINADLNVVGYPQGTTRFTVQNSFVRDVRPRNFESRGSLDRDINHLTLKLGVHPRGRSISGSLRYENTIDIFESDGSQFANRLQHLAGVRAEWRFLPITLFSLDTSFGFYGGLGADAEAFKVSSTPLRIVLGVATALTERTTIRGTVGFAKGFYSAGADYTTAVGSLAFGYRYSPVGRVVVSYAHELKDSINANFYRDHEFRITVDQQIARVLLQGVVEARLRGYRGVPMSLGGGDIRDDLLFSAGLDGHFVMRDWLAITGHYRTVIDSTEFRYTAIDVVDDPSYVRHEVMAGARAAF